MTSGKSRLGPLPHTRPEAPTDARISIRLDEYRALQRVRGAHDRALAAWQAAHQEANDLEARMAAGEPALVEASAFWRGWIAAVRAFTRRLVE